MSEERDLFWRRLQDLAYLEAVRPDRLRGEVWARNYGKSAARRLGYGLLGAPVLNLGPKPIDEHDLATIREQWEKQIEGVRESWRIPVYGTKPEPVPGELEGGVVEETPCGEPGFITLGDYDICNLGKTSYDEIRPSGKPLVVADEASEVTEKKACEEQQEEQFIRKVEPKRFYDGVRRTTLVKTTVKAIDRIPINFTVEAKETCICVAGRSRYCKAH